MTTQVPQEAERTGFDRRGFLKRAAAGAVAAAALPMLGARAAEGPSLDDLPSDLPALPRINLAPGFEVTRLICGSNPVEGYSHSTQAMTNHMLEWYTPERTVEYIFAMEKCGISMWQASAVEKSMEAVRTARDRGSKIKFIVLSSGRSGQPSIEQIKAYGVDGIVHHGGVTDSCFRTGRAQDVRDYVKKVKDAGLLAGISAHNPDCIKQAADEGWENDFFMTCMYFVTRDQQKIIDALGSRTVGHPWLEGDPDVMGDVIRQVQKPCLAFKIFAAGRLCKTPMEIENVWRSTFDRIKPTDGVITGIYKFHQEIPMNVRMVDKYGRV